MWHQRSGLEGSQIADRLHHAGIEDQRRHAEAAGQSGERVTRPLLRGVRVGEVAAMPVERYAGLLRGFAQCRIVAACHADQMMAGLQQGADQGLAQATRRTGDHEQFHGSPSGCRLRVVQQGS